MLIVSAATPGGIHDAMMGVTRKRAEELGYRFEGYQLHDSPDLHGQEPPCTFKPDAILSALTRHAEPGEIVAWLDADAILVRGLKELETLDFDVAVTLRERHMIGKYSPATYFLNAGVAFFRNRPVTHGFMRLWVEETRSTNNDQHALSNLVGRGWSVDQWRSSYNTHRDLHVGCSGNPAVRMLILDANKGGWNYWHFKELKPGVPAPGHLKILHFKGSLKYEYNWLAIAQEIANE